MFIYKSSEKVFRITDNHRVQSILGKKNLFLSSVAAVVNVCDTVANTVTVIFC